MSTRRDSLDSLDIEMPPEPELDAPADRSPPHASSRREMNKLARRVLPGAVVHIKLRDGSERRLTVEERGVPEWAMRSLAPTKEVGKILSGYGTTYLLVGNRTDVTKFGPTLTWPSKSPQSAYIASITVEEPADEQILAEKTAADLLWRVSKYDGQ